MCVGIIIDNLPGNSHLSQEEILLLNIIIEWFLPPDLISNCLNKPLSADQYMSVVHYM